MTTEPLPASPATTTTPTPTPATPASPAAPAAPTSLVGTPAAPAAEWKEYVPDPAKSEADNATAKAAHDATKPAAPATAPDPKAVAPIDFSKDIKLPEGFVADEALSKEFTDVINDDKLSRAERAQKLIDLQAKAMASLSEAGKTAWNTLQTDWQAKVQADPDV